MGILVNQLNKVYKKPFSRQKGLRAVRDVSFRVEPGEIFGLLGPNGAGKSTIIKMLTGLVRPSSGQIILGGHDIARQPGMAYRKLSAVLEGNRNIYWRLTPLENLYYFANLRGLSTRQIAPRAARLLELLQIQGKKKNMTQHLSRGMLQKLALATALITDPEIILLDEPILGLDVMSSRAIKTLIRQIAREEKKTVLITSHQMGFVQEMADRVGIIHQGQLVKMGTISDLRNVFQQEIIKLVLNRGDLRREDFNKWPWHILSVEEADLGAKWVLRIELDLDQGTSSTGIYAMLDWLREKRIEIFSFERETEALENIFMEIVKGPQEAG